MAERRGEKIGWTAGWIGGFIWVAVLSIVFLVQGRFLQGGIGLFLFGIAAAVIVALAPWRHPATPYGKLMLAPYLVFISGALWAVWSYGGFKAIGLRWWDVLWLAPLMIPLGTMSRRTWADGSAHPGSPVDTGAPRR